MRPRARKLVRHLLLLFLTACLLAASSCTSRPQSALDFSVVNHTGSTLTSIYVSPHDANSWEENVLGGDKIADGQILEIKFDPKTSHTTWDLKVCDTLGQYAEWKDLDLQRISRIVLRFNDNTAVAEAE